MTVTLGQIKEQARSLITFSDSSYGLKVTPNFIEIVSKDEENTGYLFIPFKRIKQWINHIDTITPIVRPVTQEEQMRYQEAILIGNKLLIKETEDFLFSSTITECGWDILSYFIFAFAKNYGK